MLKLGVLGIWLFEPFSCDNLGKCTLALHTWGTFNLLSCPNEIIFLLCLYVTVIHFISCYNATYLKFTKHKIILVG